MPTDEARRGSGRGWQLARRHFREYQSVRNSARKKAGEYLGLPPDSGGIWGIAYATFQPNVLLKVNAVQLENIFLFCEADVGGSEGWPAHAEQRSTAQLLRTPGKPQAVPLRIIPK